MKEIVHASLFSGFGGPDLAASWLGWKNAFHCEINEFCNTILNYWFKDSVAYEDITKTDFKKWQGKIHVLTGGFPCQPFSVAGRRKGADDHRYLWPEFMRVIREVRPDWIVGENVAGIISMVQPGTEIDLEGKSYSFDESDQETLLKEEYVIDTICRDLESEGYTVQPFVIPACAVSAPHRRDRVWIIANRNDEECTFTNTNISRRNNGSCDRERRPICGNTEWNTEESHKERDERKFGFSQDNETYVHSDSIGLQGRINPDEQEIPAFFTERRNTRKIWHWQDFPTEPPICSGDDGFSDELDNITFSKWRVESVKGYGNAIVPQVILEIFKAIELTYLFKAI